MPDKPYLGKPCPTCGEELSSSKDDGTVVDREFDTWRCKNGHEFDRNGNPK